MRSRSPSRSSCRRDRDLRHRRTLAFIRCRPLPSPTSAVTADPNLRHQDCSCRGFSTNVKYIWVYLGWCKLTFVSFLAKIAKRAVILHHDAILCGLGDVDPRFELGKAVRAFLALSSTEALFRASVSAFPPPTRGFTTSQLVLRKYLQNQRTTTANSCQHINAHSTSNKLRIVKIVNLPTSDHKVEYVNVQGIIDVADFNQKFICFACSICNKSTNAYGNGDFWCDYCTQKVATLPRTKFNIQITDETGLVIVSSVIATVFTKKAEALYDVTVTELAQHAASGNLPIALIEKLSRPKKGCVSLRPTCIAMEESTGVFSL
ncbi:uncharacterized protein LOC131327694 [Rhododendron vialii]|uniref:uncharacterized protein LOC131327694 n=1 Tax=Rhododendron vialii TaxID=182163 RepID=UPI00265D6F77|nr:uncharacterized protein LOC131327694 [Rhododendron vialii]